MRRLLAVLAFALALPALAADPPKGLDTRATVTIVHATIQDGKIQVTDYVARQVQEQVTVNEKQGDKVVPVTKTVTRTVMTPVTSSLAVKDVKVTGTDGKAIPAADLEKKLKDGGPVVLVAGPLGEDTRKVFKDGTVFIDQSAPQPPK